MDDRSSHTSVNPAARRPARGWHALLGKALQPFRVHGLPVADVLFVEPGVPPGGRPEIPGAEVIREALSCYAATLDIPMSFRSPAGRYSPPAPNQAIHLHAFALPTPPLLFGTWPRVPLMDLFMAHGLPLVERARRAFAPGTQLGRGRPLVDGDGHAVGEVLGTNLYCLFDLLGQEMASIPVLLRCHLDLGLPLVLAALPANRRPPAGEADERLLSLREETRRLVRSYMASRRREGRQAYIGACQERMAEEIRFLQDEIAFLEDGVEEMARRITSDTRRRRDTYSLRRPLQRSPSQPHPGGSELEQLQALPDVCEARVQDGRISLTTAPILAEYGGRRYRLGRFQIDLHFNGDVRIVNLTQPLPPYDHPHIHDGRPCLGDIREGVAKLLGEFQFVAAAEVLIDFLKTVNPADWRIPVLYWPEAGRETGHGVLAAT